MRWWPAIDDVKRTRRAFESASTKKAIYFLLGMSLLSGIVAVVGVTQLKMNPNALNQIPAPVILIVVGVIGFAFFFPWFSVMYFTRHFLATVRKLEREVRLLRHAADDPGGEMD